MRNDILELPRRRRGRGDGEADRKRKILNGKRGQTW